MNTSQPLDLACGGNPDMRAMLRDTLKKVAPHTTLERIGGDAQAVFGLLAITRGECPNIVDPLCSIQF